MKLKKMSFGNFILLLINIAFVLVDWRIGLITFADLLLIFTLMLLFVHFLLKGDIYFKRSQILLYLVVAMLILLNILLNILFNSTFSFTIGIQSFVKVTFYFLTVVLLFNFIREKQLEQKLLQITSLTAVIVALIGIYITISLYFNGVFPYQFLWEFTRQDLTSYTFRGWDRSIIRTRSIFSEPAHLGFYLNVILAIIYFNKSNYKVKKLYIWIITLTLLLTFSYSAILIMIGIKVLYYFNWAYITQFVRKKSRMLLTILLVVIIGLVFGDVIEKTILIRTQEILSGADGSGTLRLVGIWSYVNWERPFIGVGIGNAPAIFNIYVYILAELGSLSFVLFILFNGWLFYLNPKMSMVFIALNFAKGAYLGAGYWIFLILLMLFTIRSKA